MKSAKCYSVIAPLAMTISCIFLSACGDDGRDGQNGLTSLVNVSAIAVGDEACPLGGSLLQTGIDTNANGVLDESEIDNEQDQILCQLTGDTLTASLIGRYQSGVYGLSASEIVDFHPLSSKVFVVNAKSGKVDVIDASVTSHAVSVSGDKALSLNNLTRSTDIDVALDIGLTHLGSVNSVSIHNNLLAAAIERGDETGNSTQASGFIAFYQLNEAGEATFVKAVEVGALPDNVVFSHDGEFVLVANEGEPNGAYTLDPHGTIAIISTKDGIVADTASIIDFTDFNLGEVRHNELDSSIKINGPQASVAQDLEPEYIAISADNKRAFVSLQENNAIAVIDIENKAVERLFGLGLKDFGVADNAIDASDKDNMINLQAYQGVYGLYQPDTLASYSWAGKDFIVSANEGDARDYAGFSEEARAADLILDPNHPQVATAKDKTLLGRLKVTTSMGDEDHDGDMDKIVSFGGRSFSIWTAQGQQVFDSGNQIERVTSALLGDSFNNNNEENKGDSRSDDKGAEPEALAIGQIGSQVFVFVGLERTGGFMIYNITNPFDVKFVDYIVNRDFSADFLIDTDTGEVTGDPSLAGDLGPEGMKFVAADKSPNGKPMLIIGNEVSGTTSIYQLVLH